MKQHLLLFLVVLCPFLSYAQNGKKENGVIDRIIFGDAVSEQQHNFEGEYTKASVGAFGLPIRSIERVNESRSERRGRGQRQGGSLKFVVKVDPHSQNYFTVKFWGSDTCGVVNKVFIDGKQIGYNRSSDYDAINNGFSTALPERFYYSSLMLPLHTTRGKNSVQLEITSSGGRSINRQVYQGYVHTNPYVDFSTEKQGEKPIGDVNNIVAKGMSKQETDNLLKQYREKQIDDFNRYSNELDKSSDAKISIVKYDDQLRNYAELLTQPWCPAKTNEDKKKTLFRIFQVIDNYVKDYYTDARLVTRGGHQGDWGGFLGTLGHALYIVENQIFDENILGKNEFDSYLNKPFETNTVDGQYSMAGVDWDGKPLTRKAAWERALKANFDFSRARLSYIYNQVLYTYEGTWKAHEGLRIIGSKFFEGKERSHQILREALGMGNFLGEEILTAPDGRELDLYHSLFYHDANAFFTDDFLYIVAKGLAKSKLDADGNVVRRLPYGKHYTGITQYGLTRENGYVGNYGETPNYLPEWFYKTLDHKGDETINDEILKLALLNVHARGFTRYTALDNDGKRVMRMQQVLDDRNVSYPGMLAYAVRKSPGMMLHFASLEKYMADHAQQYSAPEWDIYWKYAAQIAGFAQQQLADNQFFILEGGDNTLNKRRFDYCLPETHKYLTSKRAEYSRFGQLEAGYVHPLTDFDYYAPDEIKKLKINTADYKQFAWTDIDCMMAVVRDGEDVISGVFNYHNRAFSGVGKIHVQNKNFDHIARVATRAKFMYEDYYIRGNSTEMDFRVNVSDVFTYIPQALTGEVCPITFQPGVGKVVRDNFEVDHPYSAFPDYLEAQYGKYMFVFNTTRDEYQNTQTFEVELPKEYKKGKVLDLISGKNLSVKKGKVSIAPNSALVLKLDKDTYENLKPHAVDFVTALAGNNRAIVNWKAASGAESYIVKRSYEENGNYRIIAKGVTDEYFIDNDIENGATAYYRITSTNKNGEAWDSYRAKIEISQPTVNDSTSIWRDDKIGATNMGTANIEASKITIRDAGGEGLGEGDDYMIHTRDIEDSFLYVNTIADSNVELSAKLPQRKAKMWGLMLRDQLAANTRYIFLGCNQFGQIVFQNRSRETKSEVDNYKTSPFSMPMIGYTIQQYPYLKLSRDADTHMVAGFISRDGKEWTKIGELCTPLPRTVYAGVCAADTYGITFEDVIINK